MLHALRQRIPFLSGDNTASGNSQPLLVVEMSDTAIRYLSVTPSNEEGAPYQLHASGCLPNSEYGTVAAWYKDASAQLRKYKIKNAKVVGLLSPQDYQLFQTAGIEAETHDELISAMRWKLKELTNVEPTEFSLDVVGMGEAGGRLDNQLVVVAAKNDLISTRLAQFEAIGVEVDTLSTYEISIAHMMAGLLPEASCLASLYVTEHEFLISASQNNRLIMFRRIPKDVVTSEEHTVPMRVIGEVVRSLDRVGRQFPDLQIDTLFVDAGEDTQAYLDVFEQENLTIGCEPLTPYSALAEEVAPLFFEQRLNALAGAALSYSIGIDTINLFDSSLGIEDVKFPFTQMMASIGVASLLMLGAGGYMAWDESKKEESHAQVIAGQKTALAAVEGKIKAAVVPAQNLQELQKTLQSYDVIETYLQSQSGNQVTPFSFWMETLARSIPEGLWLTGIKFSAPPSQETLSLSGIATANEKLTEWVERLNKIIPVDGKNKNKFDVLNIKQNSDNGYWEFTVKSEEASK